MAAKLCKRGSGGCGVRSLPEDIILEVLVRLPAKALCRFRCVSKAWCALVSDPTFLAAQRYRAGPHLVGVFFEACWPPEVRVMDMDGNAIRVFHMMDMDDGNAFSMLQQAATRLNNVIVHKECTTSAVPMIIDPAAGRACTVNVRHVAPSGALLSFGPVALSGTFKVMVMYVEGYLPSKSCKVATIVDGGAEPLRWRQMSSPPIVTSWRPKRMVTVKGVVYCLPPASSGSHHIAAFDLESEEWKTINGPALEIQEETLYAELIELKGTLGLVQFLCQPNYDNHSYAIFWLLIDFNKSVWIKEYTIQMPRTWGLTKLLGSLDDGTILLLVRETKQNKGRYDSRYVLVFYNPSIKTFTKIVDISKGFDDILVLYTGSLLS